ncbi:phage tail protein [Aeromonas piscicola]|uniref:phage tail-collar fiber domain-containing protein n=1 Tax=Aeromonas piscicola TaxID=600645 RepID=UPI0028E77DBD|nr:phage tail protein [Aeromonas piscicola]
MSQVITNAFEQYWQSSLAAEQPVVLDEFILADIPNLDITSPIDPDTGLPPESQIVHRQNVDQRGRINNNAVAYTIVMDTTVGDFSFNAMCLRNKQNGVIGMIVYKGRETKLKTDQTTGQTGNSLVKSMLMGYDQAAEATLTNVDAGTWQIDYAARLRGQDEDLRQLASQLYGHHTFIGDGFKVVQQDGGHQVTQGVAIVGGLRIELKQPQVIYPGTKPIGVWVDVHRSGSLLSEHQNHFTIITSVADLTDHVDEGSYPHYVAKLGTILADNTVMDGRGLGGAGLIGDGMTPVTWGGFAGGADRTGTVSSDAAFEDAAASELDVYVPSGSYYITEVHRGNFICADEVRFVGGGYILAKRRPLWPSDSSPSVMKRFNRVAVGDTAFDLSDGKSPTQMSWLGKSDHTAPNGSKQPNLGWIEKNARGTSFASEGAIGWAAAAHSKDMTGGAAIGLVGVGVNDNETNHVSVWALYLDAKRYANAQGTTWGCEIGVANHGTYVGPESSSLNKTIGMAIMAGADPKINGLTDDCTQALVISSNGAKFGAGVNFGASGLRVISEDAALESYMRALLLRGSQRIGWEDGDGNTLNYINAKGTNPQRRTGIHLRSGVVDIDAKSFRMMRISSEEGDTGTFRVFNAAPSNPVLRIGVEGIYDCSLRLEGTGAGEVIVNKNLRPNVANGLRCGVTEFPWAGGATQTAFAVTSDARCKTLIEDIPDVLLDIWGKLRYKRYKLIDRVEEKGEAARTHFGLLTQDVDAAFAEQDLDARDYALFCFDEWEDQYERIHLNSGEVTTRTRLVEVPKTIEVEIEGEMVSVPVGHYESRETTDGEKQVWVCEFVEVEEEYEDFAEPVYEQRLIIPAGNRYSLRYEEAYALEAEFQRRNYDRQQKLNEEFTATILKLAARISILEAS